jgi:hypothetical protein
MASAASAAQHLERQTEIYLRKILEAKEERSSISTKSKKIKTEHSEMIRNLIQQMKQKNISCVELTTRDQMSLGLKDFDDTPLKTDKHLFLKMTELTDREPKVMPRHVNLFAKQWFESKDTCIHELRETMDDFLKNIDKHLENFEK